MVRTFEQRDLITEGQFTNTDGIYLVFEGFCGIYMKKQKAKPKTDEFGRDVTVEAVTVDDQQQPLVEEEVKHLVDETASDEGNPT